MESRTDKFLNWFVTLLSWILSLFIAFSIGQSTHRQEVADAVERSQAEYKARLAEIENRLAKIENKLDTIMLRPEYRSQTK